MRFFRRPGRRLTGINKVRYAQHAVVMPVETAAEFGYASSGWSSAQNPRKLIASSDHR